MNSHITFFRKVLRHREVSQEHTSHDSKEAECHEVKRRAMLQTEEFVVSSVRDEFRQTSENKQEAMKNAQDTERFLHNRVSGVTTACDAGNNEAIIPTKEVTDRSGGRIVGGGSQHCPYVFPTLARQPHAKSVTPMQVTNSPQYENYDLVSKHAGGDPEQKQQPE